MTPGRPAVQVESAVQGEHVVTTAAEIAARRQATNRAARRRRRVFLLLLLANVAVIAVATAKVVEWWWVAAPAGLLLAWLVACRLMVRRERTWHPSVVEQVVEALVDETAERPAVPADEVDTDKVAAVGVDPDLWDPVPVTLPTYVGKATAQRTVRTIDLDATGVWTSGRSEADTSSPEARSRPRVTRSRRTRRARPATAPSAPDAAHEADSVTLRARC